MIWGDPTLHRSRLVTRMTVPVPHDPLVTFNVDGAGSVLRIRMSGELDLASVDLVDALFDLSTDGVDSIVLDLGALTFCDGTGVNALVGLRDFHQSQGRQVWFVDVLPHVRRVIALTEGATLTPRRGSASA